MIYKEFIKKLKDAIDQKGCTLKKVAEYAKIDVSYLSKIISGKRNPPYEEETIKRIAKFLDIDEDELLFSAGRVPNKYLQNFSSKEISLCLKQYLFTKNFYKEEKNQTLNSSKLSIDKKVKKQEETIITEEKSSIPEELL
jgi:transcriptional regulator with XRE-family HTH domain